MLRSMYEQFQETLKTLFEASLFTVRGRSRWSRGRFNHWRFKGWFVEVDLFTVPGDVEANLITFDAVPDGVEADLITVRGRSRWSRGRFNHWRCEVGLLTIPGGVETNVITLHVLKSRIVLQFLMVF